MFYISLLCLFISFVLSIIKQFEFVKSRNIQQLFGYFSYGFVALSLFIVLFY